ncbi:MAG: FAD-dependent oxidoreductase [Chloroflexi bacterium]|nr:FAD-dependent oxidoreductase [Chloroflexota bacterium]
MTGEHVAQQFPLLFSPVQVGRYTLRNRIVNTGHHTGYQDGDGNPTDRHVYYYRERARGGVGMIIMGTISVHPTGMFPYRNFDDSVIPWYQRIAAAVHPYGVPILQQLNHFGKRVSEGLGEMFETYAVSASADPAPTWDYPQVPVHELDTAEVEELVTAFGQAARRCALGDLDGVEIMMAFANLIPQFFSPVMNRRTDKYGGSLENRMRFAYEVLDDVRRQLGPDKMVGARFSADFLDYTTSLDDLKQIVPRLVATGMLDYVSIHTGGGTELLSVGRQTPPHYYQPAQFVYLAAAVREEVRKLARPVPVLGIGRINHPALAEGLLQEGRLDLVGMVRELIADPYLPQKARDGRLEDIRVCMACSQSCSGHLDHGLGITCIYNPVAGREREWGELPLASTKKKVVVVGGGPAGMEAARVAALRGHRVVLFERSGELGGQVNLAAKVPKRDDFGEIRRFFEAQLPKLGVEVCLRTEATAEIVLAEKPDAVVIATGSTPYRPDIPGSDSKNVAHVNEVMEGSVQAGQHVVVIDTQGLRQATDVADLLSEQGRQVEVVTGLPYVGVHVPRNAWRLQYERLLRKGVLCRPFTGVAEIGEDRVTTFSTITLAPGAIEGVDTVVLATGGKADDRLYRQLKGRVPELHAVGDCWQPRDAEAAVYEGHKVARAI